MSQSPVTVTPIFVADLNIEGERMPIYVHLIDHPEGRVLVDTGMTELHPLLADMEPRLRPLHEQDLDLSTIDMVVTPTCTATTAVGTTCSPASRSTSSDGSSTRRTPRTSTSGNGSTPRA
jgi:hypothetical protein